MHRECSASLDPWLRGSPRGRQTRIQFPLLLGSFSMLSHTSDLNSGTPVVILPGAWRYRVSAELVGRVPVIKLGEAEQIRL